MSALPRSRSLRARTLEALRAYPAVALRRAVARGHQRWTHVLPSRIRVALELDGSPISPLRVEIGSGPYPTEGYWHVDTDRNARHVESVAPAWALPFGDSTVAEILAIHVLEHVPPAGVEHTLREWLRVLRPGGVAQIHVPNAATILPAYLTGDSDRKWFAVSAIFGAPSNPAWQGVEVLDHGTIGSAHQSLYDYPLLEEVLRQAGFADVVDLTDELTDRHTEGWRDHIQHLSLIVRAHATPRA